MSSPTDPNEFTEREKYILSFYRSGQVSVFRRVLAYDVIFAVASIGCVVPAVVREDMAFGFVGYLLLLGRMYYLVTEGGRLTKDFQSIFAKYDAKLKALTEAQEKREGER